MFVPIPEWLRRVHRLLRPPRIPAPEHLRRGQAGEEAARRHLVSAGLKFLTANFRSRRGEIDLVFRDRECLVFVEVKSRTRELWGRPAAAVDRGKRRRLASAALDYMALLGTPQVRFRFDIVEVLFEGDRVCQVRHLPNAFPFARRDFYV